MKAPGIPKELAKRLKISRSTLYNILEFIKAQGVKVYYNVERQSFFYKTEVYFVLAFRWKKLN